MMKTNLKLAAEVVRKLRRQGFQAYFVGGCVRDMLMRKSPKDIDIATSARVEQIEKVFPQKTYPLGAQFGTLVVLKENIPFQVTSFRIRRSKYAKGLEQDIASRDFTVNALVYDPFSKEIIDLVGARRDIANKRIRSVGPPAGTFKADPLRLIRALRFAVTLEFRIEDKTLRAIKKLSVLIKRMSRERIRDELTMILTSANPYRGLELLDQTRLLKHILPEVEKTKGVEQPPEFHPEGDVFTHTRLMFKYVKNPSLTLAFSALLHDIGKPQTFERAERIRFSGHDRVGARMAEKLLRQLRFSNKDRERIVSCIENHMGIMEAPNMRTATLRRLLARPTFKEELELHRIDCLASHSDLKVWRFLRKKYGQYKKTPQIPKPFLNGHELIKIGFTPGPIFGKILKAMVDLQMEGKLKTPVQAKKWLIANFKKEKVNV